MSVLLFHLFVFLMLTSDSSQICGVQMSEQVHNWCWDAGVLAGPRWSLLLQYSSLGQPPVTLHWVYNSCNHLVGMFLGARSEPRQKSNSGSQAIFLSPNWWPWAQSDWLTQGNECDPYGVTAMCARKGNWVGWYLMKSLMTFWWPLMERPRLRLGDFSCTVVCHKQQHLVAICWLCRKQQQSSISNLSEWNLEAWTFS